jgi:excisionase family DNA binding protein
MRRRLQRDPGDSASQTCTSLVQVCARVLRSRIAARPRRTRAAVCARARSCELVHQSRRLALITPERMAITGNQANCDTLLSPAQVAEICGLSRRAVYDAIRRGELRAFRLCARLRISGDELADWLRRSAVRVAAPDDAPGIEPIAVAPRGSFREKLAGPEDSE